MTMAQKATSHDNTQQKQPQRQGGGLPVSIHPDDAKDKVFTAILKALLKMGNKPSSPKELANIIVKHKYATLGGATPFATVSSRISQHFKRAAEHNPPRAPLLAKHVDQNHSRKINYSLATESVSKTNNDTTAQEEEEERPNPLRTNSKTRRIPPKIKRSLRSLKASDDEREEEDDDDDSEEEHQQKRHKANIYTSHESTTSPPHLMKNDDDDEDESEGEHSDYHEEMLKGAEDDIELHPSTARRLSRRQSTSLPKPQHTIDIKKPSSSSLSPSSSPKSTTHSNTPTIQLPEETHTPPPPSSSPSKTTSSKLTVPQENPGLQPRKPSFSFSSGFTGDQELWTPFSFEHDFDNVFVHDSSTAHDIPFNIATPESVSVSELDDYFASTSTNSHRPQRKSFSSTMLGPNDKSLLQKVLLASAARGVADKIEEEPEPEPEKKQDIKPEPATAPSSQEEKKETPSQQVSTLMDVENSEDFVKFEEDEKKETLPLLVSQQTTTVSPPQQQQQQQPVAPKKVADILPATPTTLTAAEILKSMNIQNLNLSALQQMTSNIPSLQHLSPTFDLAKTMAAYMQSLAKSANTNNASNSSNHSADLKSILTRFPALEAFIKKDPSSSSPPPPPKPPQAPPLSINTALAGTATPPLLSPTTTEFPNPHSPSLTAGSTEPIVHTLTTMNPPMYITLIDHIAVCVVVLPKTEHTPEYRIMRRVDTGFINGTVLLTAGGIETESERSMILSFEMERIRMPKKKSALFGTWIPLRRAQELAVTCSIQHKLGHFLEDSVEQFFPSPLPIQIAPRKPTRDSRLTALALAALRSTSDTKNGFVVPPISRQASSSGSMAAATQLQDLLLTHPHKALKSNGLINTPREPLLGRYEIHDKDDKVTSPKQTAHEEKEESEVDIVNTSDSSVASSNDEESDAESTAEDNKKKKTPSKTAIDLQEILSRVTNKQPLHIHPRDLQKKRRRSSLTDTKSEKEEVSEPAPKSSKSLHAVVRKKPTPSIKSKLSQTKKQTLAKQATGKKKKEEEEEEDEEMNHVVVEHKPPIKQKSTPHQTSNTKQEQEQDDEDEDIDIGGSDFDDDLR